MFLGEKLSKPSSEGIVSDRQQNAPQHNHMVLIIRWYKGTGNNIKVLKCVFQGVIHFDTPVGVDDKALYKNPVLLSLSSVVLLKLPGGVHPSSTHSEPSASEPQGPGASFVQCAPGGNRLVLNLPWWLVTEDRRRGILTKDGNPSEEERCCLER